MPATEMFHNLISIFYREINKQRNILRKLLLVESTYIAILTGIASDNGMNLLSLCQFGLVASHAGHVV